MCGRFRRTMGALALALWALAPGAGGRADDLPLTGDWRHVSDPVAIRTAGQWILFSSGPGIPVRVSSDLRHWRRAGQVLPAIPAWVRERVPGADQFWAPDITRRAGRYQLYYAVSTLGSRRSVIGLATAAALDPSDPGAGWRDEGLVIETTGDSDCNAIDPACFQAADGTLWLAWGSFWSGIKLTQLDPATGKPAAGAKPIPIASRPVAQAIEGPFLVQRGGFVYLFASHDHTGRGRNSTYKVVVGRARDVRGPYVDRSGKPMLSGGGSVLLMGDDRWRGPGHNAVITDGSGCWLICHAVDPAGPGQSDLRVVPLGWTKEGWPEVERPRVRPRALPTAAGWWEHRVGEGSAGMIRLLADGSVNEAGTGTWSVSGDELIMRWPNPTAPGGAYVDRCRLNADRTAYEGANAQGVPIHGAFISAK